MSLESNKPKRGPTSGMLVIRPESRLEAHKCAVAAESTRVGQGTGLYLKVDAAMTQVRCSIGSLIAFHKPTFG